MPREIVKHINKTSNNNDLETELETLEKDSQKSLDDKIIAVCGALLGLSVGFINTFRKIVREHSTSRILFLLGIICLGITVASSVYSHYYSARCFRKYNEQRHYDLHRTFNTIQITAFILTVIFIVLLLSFLILV